jgi:hypothetical protein
MTPRPDRLWPWLLDVFGLTGTILVLILALVLCLVWVVTPLGVWVLWRRYRAIAQQVEQLGEQTAHLSRQHQVARLQSDQPRRRSRRRRRRGSERSS